MQKISSRLDVEIKNEKQFLNLLIMELKLLKELSQNIFSSFEEVGRLLRMDISRKHKEFSKVLRNLKIFLQDQVINFNVTEIKKKIDIYVEDLRKLSRELSLMAINTKIKSVNMGERGTTISVLSTEIKKAAELQNEFSIKFEEELNAVSKTLEELIKAFEDIYKNFEGLVNNYRNNIKIKDFHMDKNYIFELEQFIFKLEKLKADLERNGKLNKNTFKKVIGELKKFLENFENYITNKILEFKDLFQGFEKIEKACKATQISVNKEYQNIIKIIDNFQELILRIIKNLYFIENFSKTIENLRVLMAIEVNRIQASEFYSIVEAMNKVKQISDKAQIEMQRLFLEWQRKNEKMKQRFKRLKIINECIEETMSLNPEYQQKLIEFLEKLESQMKKVKEFLDKYGNTV